MARVLLLDGPCSPVAIICFQEEADAPARLVPDRCHLSRANRLCKQERGAAFGWRDRNPALAVAEIHIAQQIKAKRIHIERNCRVVVWNDQRNCADPPRHLTGCAPGKLFCATCSAMGAVERGCVVA